MEEFGVKRFQMLERFRWMIATRLTASVFVFIIYFFVKKFSVFNFPFVPFAACCFLEAFVNQPYSFITKRVKALDYLTYLHLVFDLILISLIIHFLGGIEFAFFSVAYPIIIVLAAIMLSRTACYTVAFLSSVAYASIVSLEFYKILPHVPLFGFALDGLHQFGIVAANILFFYFVAFLCGYSTDMIEERTEKLEQEKRFSENVIATIVDGLVILDESGRIKEANNAIERLSGFRRQELVGVNIADKILKKGTGDKFLKALKVLSEGSDLRDFEIFISSKDGNDIPMSINASLLKSPTEKPSIVAILRDTTKDKLMDKLKTEFVSNITHELLTPLTSINGFIVMILEGKAGEVTQKQKEFLEIVKKQARHLKGMIESMLDFSRMETGRLDLYPELLEVESVVAEAVSDMQPQIAEKEIKVSVVAGKATPKVLADRLRLQRAFGNIFGNAIKFTPRGRAIKIAIEEEKGFVKVSVCDEGIGLAKENLEKVFERFYQVDSALTRVIGGAGMGLAIAKEIVEKHDGRVWAESEGVGRGSTFIFTLPAA